jgi:tetratricopeptide (TPR) repeat protein
MRRSTSAAPGEWLGHFGLASALRSQGRIDEAMASLEHALQRSPENPDCLMQLFDCHYTANRFAEAEAFARRVVGQRPLDAHGWINLGVSLVSQDRFAAAGEAFERAEAIAGREGGDRHLNLGISLRDSGRLREALAFFERELPGRPSAAAHAHYGHALLAAGRLREGWAHYEFRWLQEPLLSLRLQARKPVWSGQDLRDKTILLRCEQGVGDVIQFIRYAPHVKALGATVLLQLRKQIRELAASFPGVDRIVEPGEPLPEFDYYAYLMSLPRVFGTEVSTVPARVPYLHPDPSRVQRWTERVSGHEAVTRIGLVWGGDPDHLRDRHRSIPLRRLEALAGVGGVQFFSLQKGAYARQITDVPALQLIDLDDDLRDFADTAAAISCLDLVICVDTSVAHLAAALGREVWVLVPTPSDWRWLEHREDSPWYPTMRLFRQHSPGDWDGVIERVRSALERRVGSGADSAAPAAASRIGAGSIERPLIPCERTHTRAGLTAVAETRLGIVQYWPDRGNAGRSIERYGEYLQRQLEIVGRWLPPGATVIHVGADIGLHALYFASALGDAGHLLLYESDPLCKQVLQQNLCANGVRNVTVMKRVLASRRAGDDGSSADAERFDTIDDLRLARVDWIVVSEAFDPGVVLDGAADTLWRRRPKLLLTVASRAAFDVLAHRVRDAGYQCFKVETPLFNPDNFNGRAVDEFAGRTALALLGIPEEIEVDVALDGCEAA